MQIQCKSSYLAKAFRFRPSYFLSLTSTLDMRIALDVRADVSTRRLTLTLTLHLLRIVILGCRRTDLLRIKASGYRVLDDELSNGREQKQKFQNKKGQNKSCSSAIVGVDKKSLSYQITSQSLTRQKS